MDDGPGGLADHGTELDPTQPGVDLETDPAGLVGREQPATLLGDAATQLQVGPLKIDHVELAKPTWSPGLVARRQLTVRHHVSGEPVVLDTDVASLSLKGKLPPQTYYVSNL